MAPQGLHDPAPPPSCANQILQNLDPARLSSFISSSPPASPQTHCSVSHLCSGPSVFSPVDLRLSPKAQFKCLLPWEDFPALGRGLPLCSHSCLGLTSVGPALVTWPLPLWSATTCGGGQELFSVQPFSPLWSHLQCFRRSRHCCLSSEMPGALLRAGVDLVGAGCDLGPGQERGVAFPGGRGCGGNGEGERGEPASWD